MTKKKSILARCYDTIPARRVHRMSKAKQAAREIILKKISTNVYQLEDVPCICGNTEFDTISNYDRDFLPVNIVLCRTCGMVRQSPRLNQKSLIEFYDNEYREMYNPGIRGNAEYYQDSLKNQSVTFTKITGMLKNMPIRVFEVGMHYGALLHNFKEAGCDVAGVDLDPGGLSFASKELGITAKQGSAAKLLELKEKTDLLIYIHVLEHINDLDAEFCIMRELIKDKGFLYLSVPGAIHWPRHKDNDLLNTFQLAHSWYFSLPHLVYIAAKHGFKLVQGDEKSDALFIKTEPDPDPPIPNEYERVKQELKEIHKAWTRQRWTNKVKQFFHL